MTKFIFVTGGVVSSIGKGIVAASLGRLLKNRGYKVNIQKFDPYLNVDTGRMSPYQHGEVFVTADGAETDLDLGHYERFIDINVNQYSSVSSGKIYAEVLNNEREGAYRGATVQVIPHVTNAIKDKIRRSAETTEADFVITEIGGTIGDIEGLPFIESLRQFRSDQGEKNVLFIHTTLVPYLQAAGELKTKPTQHSVKELRSYGIQPNILVLRTEKHLPQAIREKLALFCDVREEAVIESTDVETLYSLPLELQKQKMDQLVLEHFGLEAPEADMEEWKELEERVTHLTNKCCIALVGKYVSLQDAYLSVVEALRHAGYHHNAEVELTWINSEELTYDNAEELLKDKDGIIVPGGFGPRGTEGMLVAAHYARTQEVPFLGIGYGMQLAAVEFARHVANLSEANTTEIDATTPYPIFYRMDQDAMEDDMRLGASPVVIEAGTVAHRVYEVDEVEERHRNRHEFNQDYKKLLTEAGLVISGMSEDGRYVEIIELPEHPYFIGSIFHAEFTSRPNRPQPLFNGFIHASLQQARMD